MNISEFAKQLNVSTGTVSRALNNRAEVSPETRQMILAKAEELGYSRDSNALRLKTGKNRLLRLECRENGDVLSDFYLVELARAVENAAHAYGYDLQFSLGAQHYNRLESQTVDGIILLYPPQLSEHDYQILTNNGQAPVVVICEPNSPAVLRASYVCIDTMPGVQQVVSHLAGLGHRRIGYISSGVPGLAIKHALPALARAAGLDPRDILVVEAGVTVEDGYRAAKYLLEALNRPTALFARTDVLAAGAIKAAHSLGLPIPETLSVVGHDNIEACALVYPSLTTIAVDFARTGEVATKCLITMIDGDSGLTSVTLDTRLIVRKSTGPAPSHALS